MNLPLPSTKHVFLLTVSINVDSSTNNLICKLDKQHGLAFATGLHSFLAVKLYNALWVGPT